ncbi:hypothetical protein DesfrDRAFT_2407 [Solidesulfovibrio fructosivorans JJ]]|uniref:CDP-glycerol:poly(Glycerophosphate) glycerophosphotransferase n=1 Tax=Solidesulfovibrio fructosivorans JJ] TaxID=596151 RepID=E1JXQ8_SOLFR|nr:hypothetical protein [Solidesulfovibrio fructosivorans]EFL50831.1 hypothetical protein DesfrDRAFT_2407 [Solidesulfovibrio fructosivorans JJ]]
MNEASNVLLFVTINTHLRVLMDVADLLKSSGRYTPIFVYYPSAVFDCNYNNCQSAPYESYIWTSEHLYSEGSFEPAADYFSSRCSHSTPFSQMTTDKVGHENGKVDNFFRWLSSPTDLAKKTKALLIMVAQVVQLVIYAYTFLRVALFSIIPPLNFPALQQREQNALKKKTRFQRFLLHFYAYRWAEISKRRQRVNVNRLQLLIEKFEDDVLYGLKEQQVFYEQISYFIQQQIPALIILPEDNFFFRGNFIVRAAHLNAVPVAIVPFTIVNTLEWAEAFFNVSAYQADRGWNRLFAKAFPHWVLEHRGRQLIFPAIYVLGSEYFGMTPDVPWLISSGHTDALAAESQFMVDYYIRAGIRRDKIRLTGALSDDTLFFHLSERDRQCKKLGARCGIEMKDKIVLIALPPDQFTTENWKNDEFDCYDTLILFLVGVVTELSGNNFTVLINLHPRITLEKVACLANCGATIVMEPIERLVPLADLYVAVTSATIRLAISCGVPVVNYDAYQYNYDDFKGLSGVCEVRSKQEYRAILNSLLNDPQFYSRVHEAQKASENNFCHLDGKAGERMLALFDDLVSAYLQ